jgi:hypothetical protein
MTFVWSPFIHSAIDLLLTFHLEQMESGSNIGLFSKLQVSIFKARIDGSSSASIRNIFKIRNDEVIARCFARSGLGFSWDQTCQGGRLAYLSGFDKSQFQAIVSEQSHQMNYIIKPMTFAILFDLRIKRIRSTLQLLRMLKNKNLTERLLEFYPEIELDNRQLETICDALNKKICRPQTLELARCYYHGRERVADFLSNTNLYSLVTAV